MKNIFQTTLLSTAIAISFATFTPAQAGSSNEKSGGGSLSGNIGFMSEYISRGVPLSNEKLSMKGGLQYNVGNGIYAGFIAISDGDISPYGEVDAYFGYTYEFSKDLQLHAKLLSYQFPYADSGPAHYEEVSLLLRYKIFEIGVDRAVNKNVKGDMYYHVDVQKPLNKDFSVGATIGYNDFAIANDPSNEFDYAHYKVNASWKDFTLALENNDNDLFDIDNKVTLDWTKHFSF